MENTLVEKVKTVAGGPFESIHFCMLEESGNIFPSISIIFQLLKEATHTNDHMFALEICAADSI